MIPSNSNKVCALFFDVEDLSPSEPGTRETITMQYCQAGQVVATDSVSVTVAEPMFGIFAIGGSEEKAAVWNYFDEHKMDGRTDPFFIAGADGHVYSAFVWDTEKQAKIALQAEDAYVAFAGHSNFGLGYAFGEPSKITNASSFMNVGWTYADIDLRELTRAVSEGGNYGYSLPLDESKWDYLQGPPLYHWTPETHPELSIPYHYEARPTLYRWVGGLVEAYQPTYHNFTVQAGSADLPALSYKMLFLNSCNSGMFYDQFSQGSLIFTNDYIYSDFSPVAEVEFFAQVIGGETNVSNIREALNNVPALDPYRPAGYVNPYSYRG